jgi:hypothetical protein
LPSGKIEFEATRLLPGSLLDDEVRQCCRHVIPIEVGSGVFGHFGRRAGDKLQSFNLAITILDRLELNLNLEDYYLQPAAA